MYTIIEIFEYIGTRFLLVLAVLLLAVPFLACEPNNDTECDHITQEYMQALQYAKTEAAVRELEKQYKEKLNKAGC